MAKYLIQGTYTADGAKGLVKDGASGRRQAVEAAIKGLGGRLESMYFPLGEWDVIAISDLPDNVTAAAMALAVNTSGAVHIRTTVLLTAEDLDQAAKKQVGYRPPGR
jgi:uncharacterized protein with GYD domain